MAMLIVIAHLTIIILFGDKWEPSVDMFKILCIMGMFTPLNIANTEIFKSIGRSDVYLFLQTLKRLVNLIIIIWMMQYGLYPMLWGIALTGIISYILNLILTHRIVKYSIKEQLSDIFLNLIIAVFVCLIDVFVLKYVVDNDSLWIKMFVGISVYLILYIVFNYIFNRKPINILLSIKK